LIREFKDLKGERGISGSVKGREGGASRTKFRGTLKWKNGGEGTGGREHKIYSEEGKRRKPRRGYITAATGKASWEGGWGGDEKRGDAQIDVKERGTKPGSQK